MNIDLEINCHMFGKIVNNVGDHIKLKAMTTLKVDRPNGYIFFVPSGLFCLCTYQKQLPKRPIVCERDTF